MYKITIFDKINKKPITTTYSLKRLNTNKDIYNITKDIIYLVEKKNKQNALYENKALKWKIEKIL